jgi:enoyl-CoA hydratase/carnithine racemase
MIMSSETLLYEKMDYDEGSVVTLTLNKPDTLNALNIEFSREIDAALDDIERDDDVKAIIFKASGKAFSSGYDLGRVYFVYGGEPEKQKTILDGPAKGLVYRMTSGERKASVEFFFWIRSPLRRFMDIVLVAVFICPYAVI